MGHIFGKWYVGEWSHDSGYSLVVLLRKETVWYHCWQDTEYSNDPYGLQE